MTEVHPDKITELVEQACLHYMQGLGDVGEPIHQETKRLEYNLTTGQVLEIELSYINMCDVRGSTFNRASCKLSLDGKRVTKFQLNNS